MTRLPQARSGGACDYSLKSQLSIAAFPPLFSEGAEKGSMQRAEPNTCRVSREINFFTAPFYTLEDIPGSQRVRCSHTKNLYKKFNKKYEWIVHVIIYNLAKLEMKQILV
jgi:hypothetical protein